MRFSLLHQLTSYLMVLAGFGALAMGDVLSLPVTLAFLLFIALSWWSDRVNWAHTAPCRTLWNVATLIALASAMAATYRLAELLTPAIHFLLFLVVNKAFNRKDIGDYLHLYVLSFLMLLASTPVNTGLNFGVFFFIFMVVTTWAFTIYNLRKEMEQSHLVKHQQAGMSPVKVDMSRILNSKRILGMKFMLATTALSCLAFMLAVSVFAFFPRVGFGVFFSRQRQALTLSGFSDGIELGRFGVIRDDPTVVMRVEFPDGRPPEGEIPLRWRGMAFDKYDGRRWSRSSTELSMINSRGNLFRLESEPSMEGTLRQEIYLEPMDNAVVFGLDRIVAVEPYQGSGELPRTHQMVIYTDLLGGLFHRAIHAVPKTRTERLAEKERDSTNLRASIGYTVYSQVYPVPEAVGGIGRGGNRPYHHHQSPSMHPCQFEISSGDHLNYLTTPEDLSDGVGQYARSIVGEEHQPLEMAQALEAHFKENYRYTVTLWDPEGKSPLESFLFEHKEGHCEYFATAMAILLRTLGIPTRVINGFAGGVWNSFGSYYAVSHSHAHSWVEVYIPGRGWTTFDPTPAGTAPGHSLGAMSSMDLYLDWLKLRWHKHIIEYDLDKQVHFFRSAGQAFSGLWAGSEKKGGGISLSFLRFRQGTGGEAGDRRVRGIGCGMASAFVALCLLAVAVFLILRRKRGLVGGRLGRQGDYWSNRATRQYRRMVKALAKGGPPKEPSQTPTEYVGCLREQAHPLVNAVAEATSLYLEARFGKGRESESERRKTLASLERLVDRTIQSAISKSWLES